MSNETLYAQISDAANILVAGINMTLAENAVMLNLINKPMLEERARGTRTIKFPAQTSAATAEDLTEGTEYTTNNQFSLSAPSLTVKEIGVMTEYSYDDFEDTVPGVSGELLAANNLWTSDAITTKIEGYLCGLLSGFSTNDASTLGSNLGEAAWKAAIRKLIKKNVGKKNEPIIGMISEDQWGDLSDSLDTISDRGRLAQNVLDNYATMKNYKDSPYGALAFASNNVPTTDSNDIGGMFIPSALCFVWKRRMDQRTFNDVAKRTYKTILTCRFIYGELFDAWGCKLGSKAAA